MSSQATESLDEVKGQIANLTAKIGDVGNVIKEFQEKNDLNLKKFDGVTEDQLRKMGDAITQVVELKSKQELLETALNRVNLANEGKDDKETPEQKAYSKAVSSYFRKGNQNGLRDLEEKALSVNSDPDGGYFVTPAMSSRIVARIFESSPIRALATVETISTDSLEVITDNDQPTSGGWIGETASRTTTATPQIGKKIIPVHEHYASPKATQKLLDDAGVNVEQWLANKVADLLGREEATAFVNGDGVARPRGILTYSAWASAGVYESNKIEQRNSGTSADFDGDDLIDLQGDLIESYRPRASWLMNRTTFTKILKTKTSNEYVFNDFQTLRGSGFNLLGNSVYFGTDVPVIAASSLSVVYGDFGSAYTVVDRLGVRILRDPFTDKPYVNFYTTARVGGDVVNFEALKILKLAS